MKKIRSIIPILFFVLWAGASFAAPQRIVSLKPNITEILFALGVGDRVVGVTKYCDYPEEAKKLPKIADYTRPFLEPIIALKPDLVIGSREESSRKSIEELEKLGIKTEILPFTTLDETISSILKLSGIVERASDGEKIVERMRARLSETKSKWERAPKRRVLAIVGRRPLIVFGRQTYMDEILQVIGAQNVVPPGSVKYPRWSAENVIAANPDVILDFSMGSESGDPQDVLKSWENLKAVNAVRGSRVYHMDIGEFRQSPRILDGIERLAAMIHSP